MHSPHLAEYARNIDFLLPMMLEGVAGNVPSNAQIQTFCAHFRNRGVLRFLVTADIEPVYVGLMQSAAAYLYFLQRAAEEDQVTSFAKPLFDAVAGSYWGAATEIAELSRTTVQPDYEYEDDFLYVHFLMQALLLEAAPPVVDDLMRRYADELEGAYAPRLEICRALSDRDGARFDEHLLALIDEREELLRDMISRGSLHEEEYAPLAPIYLEGVALVRFADHLGLPIGREYLHVPELLRRPSPFVFDRDAWREPDFKPQRAS